MYFIFTILFDYHSKWFWLLRAIFTVLLYRYAIAHFLRRKRDKAVHRYWLSKADIGSLSAREREFMAKQAKIWKRYAGMKGVPLDIRQEEFTRESRALLERHERYKGKVRLAVYDERINQLRKEMYGE